MARRRSSSPRNYDALQAVEAFSDLFEQCCLVGAAGTVAFRETGRNRAAQAREAGEPFLKIIIEPVLRLPELKVEKPEDQ